MQIPSIGRVVLVRGLPNFGSDLHVGLVQKAYTGPDGQRWFVNVVIFPEGGMPVNLQSIEFFQDVEVAEREHKAKLRSGIATHHAAFYPPRV